MVPICQLNKPIFGLIPCNGPNRMFYPITSTLPSMECITALTKQKSIWNIEYFPHRSKKLFKIGTHWIKITLKICFNSLPILIFVPTLHATYVIEGWEICKLWRGGVGGDMSAFSSCSGDTRSIFCQHGQHRLVHAR